MCSHTSVLGPLSFSKTRLWSCALPKNLKFLLSTTRKKLASSPVKNSSKTTFLDDLNLPLKTWEDAFNTWCFVLQIVTPLPAANPSAFTTTGNSVFFELIYGFYYYKF